MVETVTHTSDEAPAPAKAGNHDTRSKKRDFKSLLRAFERIIFGIMIGIVAAIVGMGLYYEAKGLYHLSSWERSFDRRHLERTGELMKAQIDLALAAMEDDQPIATSEFLAGDFAQHLYRHHTAYATKLLERGDVESFNQLRIDTGFIILDLSRAELSSLNLEGADFRGVSLLSARFIGCKLDGADFSGADLTGANLSGAEVSEAIFYQANLSSALLTGISGRLTDFRESVLAGTSMMTITGLEEAHFGGAVLSQANLWGSAFPGANFDSTDLTMASAVETDLSEVVSMNDVILTGANLSSAKLIPERMARAWLVNTEGLSPRDVRLLRQAGGVIKASDVLDFVDKRIIEGFAAQIEADEMIKPEQRQSTLLNMLQDYYLQ